MATISSEDILTLKRLYSVQKLSASTIAKGLGVSLDAVYYAMRKHNIPRRNPSENNKIYFLNKSLSYKLKHKLSPDKKSLKLAGAMLYWSEGYKTSKSSGVDFANSDVEMVKLFVCYLRNICGVDEKRIRIYLYCHEHRNTRKLISFWSKHLKISKDQFTKPYINTSNGVDKSNKMPYGLVHIRYADKKLLGEILGWIDEYKKEFCVDGGVVNRSSL